MTQPFLLKFVAVAFFSWCGCGPTFSAAQPYVLWATTAGGLSQGGGEAIALTPAGELIVIENRSPSPTAIVMKFDQRGTVIASNALAGAFVAGVATDAAGALYLTGNIPTNALAFPGARGLYVAKLDRENRLIWVRSQSSGEAFASGSRVAVDSQGNVHVGGYSTGPMTLGGSSFGAGQGPLVCRFDAQGSLTWAKRVQYSPTNGTARGSLIELAIDASGNLITGGFLPDGTANFDGATVFPGSTGRGFGGDWYLAKHDSTGDLQWVRLTYATSLAVDRSGDIYVGYNWARSGGRGIAKLNSAGELLWSKALSVNIELPQAITLDADDQPVFAGSFGGTAMLGAITLTARDSDFFVAKADAQGNIQWAISGGGTEFDRGEHVVCDSLGNVFFTGIIRRDAGTFDGIPLIPLGSPSETTLIVAKIEQAPQLKIAPSAETFALSWPVRASNYVLEAATAVISNTTWTRITNPETITGEQRTVPVERTGDSQFFRLQK